MKTKSIRLVKKHERPDRLLATTAQPDGGAKNWSATVRSWVTDSQNQDRSESLPTFDSLFKQALPQSGQSD